MELLPFPRKELPRMPSSSPKVGGTGAIDTSVFHRQHTGTRKKENICLVLMQSSYCDFSNAPQR